MNNKKTIIVLILILLVGIVGLTVAYFSNTASINNLFSTNPYGTTVEEEFVSPDNWLPGDTTDKTITVTNSGSVDEAVRISYQEQWKAKDKTILSGLIDNDGNLTSNTENSEHAAIINFSDNNDWTQSNGYYYYNYRLAPGETTSSLIDSVTFNSKVKNSSNCVSSENNGTKTITCNSTQSGYDGAKYTLTFTIETVQYNKYKEAWGVDIATFNMRPMSARDFISKANPVEVTNYTDGDIHEMYTFEHAATEQTPALTDYRYIGNDPYNYVYFNCDSLENQNEDTCEVWRIIGVFDVEDEDGNWETRFKLVRGSALPDTMAWDSFEGNNTNLNDWTQSTIKNFLNTDYYNREGNTQNYGIKIPVQQMISNTKYYLGAHEYGNFGNAEQMYNWERGNKVCGSCNLNDIKKNWIGKIALMNPSDHFMVYGKSINNECFSNPTSCKAVIEIYNPNTGYTIIEKENPGYPEMGWIYNSNIIENHTDISSLWYLNSNTGNDWGYDFQVSFIFNVLMYGNVADISIGLRPTLYLKSNVKLTDGNGSQDNPYKLGYDSSDLIYTTYTKGQTVTYDNQQYYVMSTSEGNKSYVKLLKATPLIASEINAFNTNYVSTNGEYPYLENSTCTNGNTSNCTTNYDSSSIKYIIDNWSNSYNNDLVSINGYKARLVNNTDIMDYFAYESYYASPNDGYRASSDTPSWAYINGSKYWSMYNSSDSNYQVYGVSNTLSSEEVYNKLYIRPVINLKKCAIEGTC